MWRAWPHRRAVSGRGCRGGNVVVVSVRRALADLGPGAESAIAHRRPGTVPSRRGACCLPYSSSV